MDKLIKFTSKAWNSHALIINYKGSLFKILFEDLEEETQQELTLYSASEWRISGSCYLSRRDIVTSTITLSFNRYGIPVKLKNYKITPTEYVAYKFNDHACGMMTTKIQKNGFLVYCAPTGQGKTFFALSNIESLGSQFDTVLYINLELSIDDIKNRCNDMNINIPENLYVSPLDNVDVIEEWAEDKGRCCFIVDNIDNLVGGSTDAYAAQLNFIKDLDRYLKDNNHHALVLTQLVKENAINLFGKDGEINSIITTNILSGVKQLSYLSRTVMMTAYSPELQAYVYKYLKVGSAKRNE